MSVKRLKMGINFKANHLEMVEDPDGDYVRHEDYAALEEVNTFLQEHAERLQAELRRIKQSLESRMSTLKSKPGGSYTEGMIDAFNLVLRDLERRESALKHGD